MACVDAAASSSGRLNSASLRVMAPPKRWAWRSARPSASCARGSPSGRTTPQRFECCAVLVLGKGCLGFIPGVGAGKAAEGAQADDQGGDQGEAGEA